MTDIGIRGEEASEVAAVTGRRARRRNRSAEPEPTGSGVAASRTTKVLIIVGLALFLFYSIAPVWWLIVSSTKNEQDLLLTSGMWFANFNLMENLQQIFTVNNGVFLRWTANSLILAGVGALGATLLSLAAGYGLARFDYPGRKVTLVVVIASFLVPYSMLTLPLYLMFASVGLTDSLWAVLIPTFISPFSVYLAKVYVEGAVPPELLEAARMDGAGEIRIFIRIVLPMLTTAGATIFLLAFIGSWNGFFLPLTMLQSTENWTMSLGLYNWLRQSYVNSASTVDYTSIVITGSLLSVIPLALVMIAMQRFWRTGVSLGAVK